MPAHAADGSPEVQSDDGPKYRMAITFDDLPAHGALPEGVSRLQVHQEILAVLRAHEVPQVYGFANLARAAESGGLEPALRAWVDAGYPLANHSYSHPHMRDVGVEAYLADIDANEAGLAALSPGGFDWKVYRYPFLEEGDDLESAQRVRAHLDQKGYRVAEVTVDFYDWAYNAAYARCVARGDEAAITGLERSFLSHAAFTLRWADDAARMLFDRPIPHVLLMHVGAFDARMLDDLLTRYEKMGVQFISLDEALADPAYALFEPTEQGAGGTLLEQLIEARDAAHPPWFTHPYALLDGMCHERPAAKRNTASP